MKTEIRKTKGTLNSYDLLVDGFAEIRDESMELVSQVKVILDSPKTWYGVTTEAREVAYGILDRRK